MSNENIAGRMQHRLYEYSIIHRLFFLFSSYRIFEVFAWWILFFIITMDFNIAVYGGMQLSRAYLIFRDRLMYGGFVIFFPILFKLIFGALPFEFIRMTWRDSGFIKTMINNPSHPGKREIHNQSHIKNTDERTSIDFLLLLSNYAADSRRISEGIYGRAGVYLMLGVLVAFSGLAFFYTQTIQQPLISDKGTSDLMSLVPKVGILFFIELVAFFFLRQYRGAMDEFRYYEAVKRNREETLALICMISEEGKISDPIKLIEIGAFFSKAGILDKQQSTEILESRKLEKSEIEVLERIVDIFSRNKK